MTLAATSHLTTPDYIVTLLYLAGTIGIGVAIGRKMKTGSEFFLGGRQLPWWAIGMSLVATDIGGTDIIGVGGAAYTHGLAVANFEWIGCIPAMIIGAFLFIPFFYRTGVFTIPEYLERRYNVGVRTVMAICWLLFMACNLGIMLLASAKMMSAVFGWNEPLCILVTAVLVGAYTCVGGLAAVVYTDMIQCTVMIIGCLLVLVLGIIEVGGFEELQTRLAEVEARQMEEARGENEPETNEESPPADRPLERTSLLLPADTTSPFPWTGIYFGLALILSPAYWIGNQAIVQRSLGAKSDFEAKASYIWGALLKNIIPIIVAVPGLVAMALIPDLESGDTAIPSLVNRLLPVGLRGLFVAAFLAALMSSVDSYLNSSATIVSNDLYKRFVNRNVTDEQLLTIGRVTTLALVLWAVIFAFLLTLASENSGIYAIFQTLMAFFQGPAFAVLLFGMLWKRATGKAAFIALLCGIATSISLYILSQEAVTDALGWEPLFRIQEPFLYFSVWAFLVTAFLLVLISLITPIESDVKLKYVFHRAKSLDKTDFSAAAGLSTAAEETNS
ncbi:sodium:solute symporter family transporter [Thalassoglobus polymorphus]|uniref:Sodium/glucose cotransporter n=1 Tax=Thalassoglobus polymorphus TaxID=2527994 RepID=A0A517QPA7_9PLAN|nr:sodium/solute symporter [Thalassoglobus polymorphus]QDT33434.1 Sodium/glucose cotransporter [Thalassoglobus polymorphus]